MCHILTAGDLSLDFFLFTVTTPKGKVQLTPTEFQLLRYLMRHPGQLHSWRKLFKKVWGCLDPEGASLVRTYVHKLRDKIGAERIQNIRPHGYVLVVK